MDLTIEQGNPKKNGMYVTYIGHQYIKGYPDKKLLTFVNGEWSYPSSSEFFGGVVHGWIGPLPTPTIDELIKSPIKYAISYRPDGEHGAFLNGPFDNLNEALETFGHKGEYIYELHLDKDCIPIRKWSEKKMKWLKRKK